MDYKQRPPFLEQLRFRPASSPIASVYMQHYSREMRNARIQILPPLPFSSSLPSAFYTNPQVPLLHAGHLYWRERRRN
jgi:hypothetical protein